MIKNSRKLRHYVIPVVICLILFSVYVIATTTISNNKVESTYFNTTDSNYKISRTANVVVCRGTSVLDDIYKSITCDVVCKSTDTDCGDEVSYAFNNFDNVYVKKSSSQYVFKTNLNISND